MTTDVMGAKLALFIGEDLAVILRDDRPGLLWADHWDLPGGGREGNESPLDCAIRETREELSLTIAPQVVTWGRAYQNSIGRTVWFFAAQLPAHHRDDIVLGDEGQRWDLMAPDRFLADPKVVPVFKPRLRDYLDGVNTQRFN